MAAESGDPGEPSPFRGLPARPLSLDELERIEAAGAYDAVKPLVLVSAPRAPEGADLGALAIVVVAPRWSAGLRLDDDGWRLVERRPREPGADVPVETHVFGFV